MRKSPKTILVALYMITNLYPRHADAGIVKKFIVAGVVTATAIGLSKKFNHKKQIENLKSNSPEAALEDGKTYIPKIYTDANINKNVLESNEKNYQLFKKIKSEGWVPVSAPGWCGPGAIAAQYQVVVKRGSANEAKYAYEFAVEWIKDNGGWFNQEAMTHIGFANNAEKITNELIKDLNLRSRSKVRHVNIVGENYKDIGSLSYQLDGENALIISLHTNRLWGYLAKNADHPSALKDYLLASSGEKHYVSVLGVERNLISGAPEYFYIGDTGIPDPETWHLYKSMEELRKNPPKSGAAYRLPAYVLEQSIIDGEQLNPLANNVFYIRKIEND